MTHIRPVEARMAIDPLLLTVLSKNDFLNLWCLHVVLE